MRQRCVVRQLAAQLCGGGPPIAKNTYGHKIDGLDDVGAVTTAPRPLTRAEDPPGADKPGLSPAEAQHFKERGYVIKRGYLLPDQCAAARDWCWTQSQSTKTSTGRSGRPMDRDDPST